MYALAALALVTLAVAGAPKPERAVLTRLPEMDVVADAKIDVRLIPTWRTGRALPLPVPGAIALDDDDANAPFASDDWIDEPLWMHRLNPAQLRLYESWLPAMDWDRIRWRGGVGWGVDMSTRAKQAPEQAAELPAAE